MVLPGCVVFLRVVLTTVTMWLIVLCLERNICSVCLLTVCVVLGRVKSCAIVLFSDVVLCICMTVLVVLRAVATLLKPNTLGLMRMGPLSVVGLRMPRLLIGRRSFVMKVMLEVVQNSSSLLSALLMKYRTLGCLALLLVCAVALKLNRWYSRMMPWKCLGRCGDYSSSVLGKCCRICVRVLTMVTLLLVRASVVTYIGWFVF